MFCKNCGTNIPEGAKFCPSCGWKAPENAPVHVETTAQTSPPPAQAAPPPPAPQTAGNKAALIAVIAAAVVVVTGIVVFFVKSNALKLDEGDMLIIRKQKNYDIILDSSFNLEVSDVKKIIKFIKKNYPAFYSEVLPQAEDEWWCAGLVEAFNENAYKEIYLRGNPGMAGYSSVYSQFFIDDGEMQGFTVSVDNEFSDTSGIESMLIIPDNTYPAEVTSGGVVTSLGSTNDTFMMFQCIDDDWYIIWNDNTPGSESAELFGGFLQKLPTTEVFENIDIDWFGDVYLNPYRQIKDLW